MLAITSSINVRSEIHESLELPTVPQAGCADERPLGTCILNGRVVLPLDGLTRLFIAHARNDDDVPRHIPTQVVGYDFFQLDLCGGDLRDLAPVHADVII